MAPLASVVAGGVVASVFGLYQLIAFYLGWPQGIEYRAVDQSGLGRISSFSYEAAYFAYFLILVAGALFALAALRGRPVNIGLLVFFGGVLLLANSRAIVFTVPVFAVLLYVRWAAPAPRRRIWPLIAAAGAAAVLALAVFERIRLAVWANVSSIFNPNEVSSNAPRLDAVNDALRIIGEHPIIGVGPGNFIEALRDEGARLAPDATSNSVVANNVWLQALLDGGAVLLLVVIVLVVGAIVRFYLIAPGISRPLMAAWITVLGVGGMLTSNFWDLKMWAMLGIAAVVMNTRGVAGVERTTARRRHRAASAA